MHLILDTDIGTDVDDAMTLIQLIGCNKASEMTITTVYGDTGLRAQIAKRYCKLASSDIKVFAGETKTLSGKDIWISGLEGSLHEALDDENYESLSAVDHLLNCANDFGGELVILAIGPLTNIAKACLRDPAFATKVKHLFVMGGRFEDGDAEHNFVSDAVAADIVFSAGFEATVVGLEATHRIKMPSELIERIKHSGPAGLALSNDIYQWWEFWQETWNVPHDPIAALAFLDDSLFTFSALGSISVANEGPVVGKSVFAPGEGKHRIVLDFEPEKVAEEIVKAIEASRLLNHASR
jgi:purine nucleosidase